MTSDVCLILEGTYPYVSGGVSTWIHQLVTTMKDIRFSIVCIMPFADPTREFKYDVPSNVVDIQEVILHDYALTGSLSNASHRLKKITALAEIQERLMEGNSDAFIEAIPLLRDPKEKATVRDVFESKECWETIASFYHKYGEEVSFLDYFWTWRAVYLPLYNILTAPIPEARIYHTVCTGFAGVMASVAKSIYNKKMILTEHGIYTHERLLEISQASWIYEKKADRFRISRKMSFFKRFWYEFFHIMGSIGYHYADAIVTLYEGNRTREILAGANPHKTSVIPNGIDLAPFLKVDFKFPNKEEPLIGFIGRVVPIKDVKTFLEASQRILQSIPKAKFHLIGPMDEEPEYTMECRQLVEALKLQKSVEFVGKQNVKTYIPKLDLVVLTSLSEAQPYVILEANACGIPVVTTDVGACREMVDGRLEEDKRLGPSGLITSVSSPEATATASLQLLSNGDMWRRYAESGRERVKRYYDQNDLIGRYLSIYEQHML